MDLGYRLKRQDLIEPELSYRIVGALFDVYNALGTGYQERIYQRALAATLRGKGLLFREQVLMDVVCNDQKIGKYFLDFLIEGKIIVELKQGGQFSKQHFDQVTAYLKACKIPLAILANFTPRGVVFKRVLNPDSTRQHS